MWLNLSRQAISTCPTLLPLRWAAEVTAVTFVMVDCQQKHVVNLSKCNMHLTKVTQKYHSYLRCPPPPRCPLVASAGFPTEFLFPEIHESTKSGHDTCTVSWQPLEINFASAHKGHKKPFDTLVKEIDVTAWFIKSHWHWNYTAEYSWSS